MPDFLSEPERWVISAVLLIAVLGVPIQLWWERRRPSSYARRGDALADWRLLSTGQQEYADEVALHAAEDAARLAVERATQINAVYHP